MFEQSKQQEKSVISGRTSSKSEASQDTELYMKRLKRNMTGPVQMFAQDEEEEKVQRKSRENEDLQMKSSFAKASESVEEKQIQPAFAKATESVEEKQIQPAFAKATAGNKTEIPEDIKSKMETSFGTDFGDVNIHKDSEQATNLGALAYTQGNEIMLKIM